MTGVQLFYAMAAAGALSIMALPFAFWYFGWPMWPAGALGAVELCLAVGLIRKARVATHRSDTEYGRLVGTSRRLRIE
jgi:hypothetical protein